MSKPGQAWKRSNTARFFVGIIATGLVALGAWRALRPGEDDGMMSKEEMEKSSRETYSEWSAARPGSSMVAKALGGDEVLGVLSKPDRGSVFRLEEPKMAPQPRPMAIPVVAGPFAIPPDILNRIGAVLGAEGTYRKAWELRADGTYGRGMAKGCLPSYGVRFRLEKGPRVVDVFLCYGCGDIITVPDGKSIGGGLYFDPGRDELVAIAQALFPDDAKIQSMKSGKIPKENAAPQGSR